MANKGLGPRQKLRIRLEPSQRAGPPRNPIAVAARQRVAGSHAKGVSARRQAAKRALAKTKLEPDE